MESITPPLPQNQAPQPTIPQQKPKHHKFKWFLSAVGLLIVLSWISSQNKPVEVNINTSMASPSPSRVSKQASPPSSTVGSPAGTVKNPAPADPNACKVKSVTKSNPQGIKVYSPKGDQYVINKEDEKGIHQVYLGRTGSTEIKCITCEQQPGGPAPSKMKMQPSWHPSGKWLTLAVERDTYTKPWIPPLFGWDEAYYEGQLQNGLWTNIWSVTPDGKTWNRLSDFKSETPGTADGFTGVAFTPDGKKGVYSQIMDGNIFAYWPFGRWELTMVDVTEVRGVPKFSNHKNITPANMPWNEPGGFHGDDLLFTGSVEKDAQGMDQYLLNIKTNKLTNLNNTPTIWDEHGTWSPDGSKIIWMSAWPYRSNPESSKVTSIKTEFMLMNRDGTNYEQLTHFREQGHPQYTNAIAGVGIFSPDGRMVSGRALNFPNYEDYDIVFQGVCGA